MPPSTESLAALLEEQYASGPVTLHPIGELNPVYRVDRAHAEPWVVRVGRNVPRYTTSLLFLNERRYPAPILIPAADGSPLTLDGDQPVIVMNLIPGVRPRLEPGPMELVGAALARLHALDAPGVLPAPSVRSHMPLPAIHRAGMLPRGEIAAARSWLDSVRHDVPSEHRAHFQILDNTSATIDLCEDLPPAFIHGDAHYNNTILTPSGDVVYLDYDSFGPGPAIVDLGFLLVNADAAPIVAPPRPRDPARVEAVIRGYCRHRLPSEAELTRLVHAIRFRPLMWACATFAREIERGAAPSEWLLRRLEMSNALAAQASDVIRAQPLPSNNPAPSDRTTP